ncbi:MAG: hypothetical protein KC582_04030 [Candidatus Magasanikbacteria bacterium]|nr:hypothetical protein [Candidatus Magasanikbacteria bacterium]
MRLERNVHTPNKLSLQADFHEDGPTFSFLWMGEAETQKSNYLLIQIDKSLQELASPLTETRQHFKGWPWKAHTIHDERSFHSAIHAVLTMVAIQSIEETAGSQTVDRSGSQQDASVGIAG